MVVQEDLSADLVTHGELLKVQHAQYLHYNVKICSFCSDLWATYRLNAIPLLWILVNH